jgi:hypothetical protein
MTADNYTYYSVIHFGNRKEVPLYEDEKGFCTICVQNHNQVDLVLEDPYSTHSQDYLVPHHPFCRVEIKIKTNDNWQLENEKQEDNNKPSENRDNKDNRNSSNDIIPTMDKGRLDHEGIVIRFIVKSKAKCIAAKLSHMYKDKAIGSTVYRNCIKRKRVSVYDILMLTNIIDENNNKVAACSDEGRTGDNGIRAIEVVKENVAKIFLDVVSNNQMAGEL